MEPPPSTLDIPPGWAGFAKTLYRTRRPPVVPVSAERLEAAAREKIFIGVDAFLFVFDSAGTGSTKEANYAEFKKWRIIPRVLRNVTTRTLDVRLAFVIVLFGVKYSSPLLLSPVGAQTAIHPDGECASAKAAGNLGGSCCTGK